MKTALKNILIASAVAAAAVPGFNADARPSRADNGAKYVFFFLGDGMANAQVQATEAYLTTVNGGSARNPAHLLNPANRLNMCKLPVQGMQTTSDDGALITDSASAGTAFASGIKTKSGVIGKNTAKTQSYKSVATLAHEKGKSVGILSSVNLNHATPAAYYANVDSRNEYNTIGMQLANSGFEFFGGGGIDKAIAGTTNVWNELSNKGYSVISNRAAILNLTNSPQNKVVCINPVLAGAAMPYEIDRPAENLSLAEMTQVAIKDLQNDPDGFFIMVEGGKIDWACHANDAVAALMDMLDFDDSVAKAIEFYNAHPNDTLIIVTGDHETGGMSVGHATTGYSEAYTNLLSQTESFEAFQANEWATHKAANTNGYDWTATNNLAGNANMLALMSNKFGLVWANLNDYQKEKLEDAYDKSMVGANNNSGAENTYLYEGYMPIIVTITHILNERASIGWTSYSHTGVPTPVYAAGFESYRFAGFYDNTDIAKQIAAAMRV